MIINRKSIAASLTALTVALSGPAAITVLAAHPDHGIVQLNQGNLISALNNIAVQIERLNALNNLTVTDVQVVNVQDVLNNNNVLNNALNRNNVEILNLRNVLNNNEIIKNALNNVNINISRVVAIDVLSGGDVIVFYQ